MGEEFTKDLFFNPLWWTLSTDFFVTYAAIRQASIKSYALERSEVNLIRSVFKETPLMDELENLELGSRPLLDHTRLVEVN